MKKETYVRLMDFWGSHSALGKILKIAYSFLPLIMVIAYPVMVIIKGHLAIDREFLLMITVPAVVFVGIKVLRVLINRPRPYEKFATPSFISKEKSGKSFPSNHAACAFIIAMSAFALNSVLAFVLLGISVLIAISRILSGVHFISDVLAGTLISIIFGFIFIII